VLLNDPYLGGTHLPDVTAIAPAFADGELVAFAACRAHHANIGGSRPGSMPVAERLDQEGILIRPMLAMREGELTAECARVLDALSGRRHASDADYRSDMRLGDFYAQLSAARLGVTRLHELAGASSLAVGIGAVNAYAERLARRAFADMPRGVFEFEDVLDDDGFGTTGVPIRVAVTLDEAGVVADFSGSGPQVRGNVNCPRSVLAAAAYYVFRCLMPAETPAAAGAFRPIRLLSTPGTVVDALPPAAVAAGNVETSQRIVDVLLGALAKALPAVIPAASQGTMNNLSMGAREARGALGARDWDYYETLAGTAAAMGCGASSSSPSTAR
jgi:N-methylhydantoinase B